MILSTFAYFSGLPCLDPYETYKYCLSNEYPTSWSGSVNMYACPAGRESGCGKVLLSQDSIDKLNIEGLHYLHLGAVPEAPQQSPPVNSLLQTDPSNASVLLGPMLVTDVRCITAGGEDDENNCYLVEFKDYRQLVLSIPIDLQINLPSPSPDGYYASSLNNGVPYTWDTALETLWTSNGKLGAYPGLPYAPSGVPQGYHFLAKSSWEAINILVEKLNCVVIFDPRYGTFSIVRVGFEDLIFDTALAYWTDRAIIDDEFALTSKRAKAAESVRVYFYKQQLNYGIEPTQEIDNRQWITNSTYFIDILTNIDGVEPQTKEVFWDDTPALLDNDGTVTNPTELQVRAQDITDGYIKLITTGTDRLHKTFSGAVPDFCPNSQIKLVIWKSIGAAPGKAAGLTTEIYRSLGVPCVSDGVWNGNYDLIKNEDNLKEPDFSRHTYPHYFPQLQILRITDYKPVRDSTYPAELLIYNIDEEDFDVVQSVYLYIEDPASVDGKYFGKIQGTYNGLQLYVAICCGSITGFPVPGLRPGSPAVIQITSNTPNADGKYPGTLIQYTLRSCNRCDNDNYRTNYLSYYNWSWGSTVKHSTSGNFHWNF
jgi:hypothetical protein